MRVVHVLPTRAPEYGGPVRVAEALSACLVREGHEAEIVAPSAAATSRLAYWPGVRALRTLMTQIRKADLVHIHGLWTVPTSTAAYYARQHEIPIVITPHGMLGPWSLRHHALRKKVYASLVENRNLNLAAAIHYFNDEERDEARVCALRPETFLLPNGVDIEQFDALPGREALWRSHPSTEQRFVILFLGRLHPKKGLPLLIEVLSRIVSRRSDVHLVIAGPDEAGHRAEVEALVERKGLQKHVLFTGLAVGDHKRILLGGADVFVLPSFQEGDAVAVKEALAAGLPVVITHPCHFRQVAEAEAGFVVRPDVDEVHDALLRLCCDPALRDRMASRARPLIERHYRWDNLGRELVRHYQSVLARHSTCAGASR